jgi:hypothetical protein
VTQESAKNFQIEFKGKQVQYWKILKSVWRSPVLLTGCIRLTRLCSLEESTEMPTP